MLAQGPVGLDFHASEADTRGANDPSPHRPLPANKVSFSTSLGVGTMGPYWHVPLFMSNASQFRVFVYNRTLPLRQPQFILTIHTLNLFISQTMPGHRNMKRCPLCTSIVQRLRAHVRSQHGNRLTELQVKIVANIGNIQGRTAYRGRLYKICPVDGCGAVTRFITAHLRRQHALDTDDIRRLHAQPVGRYEMPDMEMVQDGRPMPAEVADRSEDQHDELTVATTDGRPRDSTDKPVIGAEGDAATSGSSPDRDEQGATPGRPRVQLGADALEFRRHLQRRAGGQRTADIAEQYARTTQKFLDYCGEGIPGEVALSRHNVEDYLDHCESEGLAPGTLTSRLTILLLFASCLHYLGRLTAERLAAINASLEGTKRSLNKQKVRRRLTLAAKDREQVVAPGNLSVFYEHSTNTATIDRAVLDGVGPANVNRARRYIMSNFLLASGARSGVLEGLTIEEIEAARREVAVDGTVYYVIAVANHKTANLGSFLIPALERWHLAALALCRYVRESTPTATHPFVSSTGRPFPSSRVGYELREAWRETGCQAAYGDFSSTKNRKRFATLMADFRPDMRDAVARQLRHSSETERRYYDLGSGPSQAVNTVNVARNVERACELQQLH